VRAAAAALAWTRGNPVARRHRLNRGAGAGSPDIHLDTAIGRAQDRPSRRAPEAPDMSTRAVTRTPRAAFVLACAAMLLAPALATAAPPPAAPAISSASTLTAVGEATPIALGPGTPSNHEAVFAKPFLTLDPGALRAAKLHAAAVASRGQRGPDVTTHVPLAGIFNNTNAGGLSQPTVAPPDSTGAIGPNHYVEMVNQEIGVYNRNLGLISSTDNGTFMGTGGAGSVSDPQIQWDGQGGHWLYAALDVSAGANMLLFGWSKTSDPSDLTNGWCRFGIARGYLLDDYPKLGHDDNFISIGVNVYDDRTNYTFITANIFAIHKPGPGDTSCSVGSALYVADEAHHLHNADGSTAFTPVPANTTDASPNGYIVAAHSPVDGVGASAPKIMVWHWASSGGTPILVSDGEVAVSTFDIPAPVPQPGTSYTLDSLDARLTQAVAANDPTAGGAKGIWTQHTVAGPGGRSVVRWYEILGGTPPTLRQQADVSSPTDFVFNGAVSPSIGGDSAAVFYNRGGASTLPIIGARSRSAATPLNSLDSGELVVAQSSAADLDFTCGYYTPTTPCRWGDYAGASPDPQNAGVVWGSSQITGPCLIFCGFFAQWTTQNFAVVASTSSGPFPPGAPVLNPPTAGNGSVGLSWSAPSSNGGATITDYAVYRSTSSGNETFLANTGGALTYSDTGLTNGTTYYYKVAAINSAGTGSPSNEVSATPRTTPGAPVLNTPTAGNGSVGLSWSAPASNGGATITDYAVYRSTTSGQEAFLANTGGALTYNDAAVTNGTTYYYEVAAINSAGTGALSNERSATPSAPPPTPDFILSVTPTSRSITRGSSTTYTVTVTAVNGFTGFVSLSSSISPSANGATMSFNPTGLTLGTSASSTFTVGTAKKTTKKTYTITITATSSGIVHSTTVTLVLQ
jgi:hypothetical protein